MKNLNEALADIKNTIETEGYTDGLIEDIAEDWDLNPVLLARKFEEKYGMTADRMVFTKVEITEEQYKARYEAGMARQWRSHERMYWSSLTEAEKERTRAFLLRNWTNEKLSIVWK